MKNNNVKLVSLFFLIIVFLLINCKSETNTNSPIAVDMVKITKVGDSAKQVKMSHEAHVNAEVKCIACHHKEGNDDRIKKCEACHEGEEGKDLMHGLCITCHKEKKDGPTACNDCHKI